METCIYQHIPAFRFEVFIQVCGMEPPGNNAIASWQVKDTFVT